MRALGVLIAMGLLAAAAGPAGARSFRVPADGPETAAPGQVRPLVYAALRFAERRDNERLAHEALIAALAERGIPIYPRAVLGSHLDLVDWIAKGKVDLAWMPPFSLVSARETEPELEPLATVLRRDPAGQIVDHTTSMIATRQGEMDLFLADPSSKRLHFGGELSTSGFLYPMSFLLSRGIQIPQPYRYCPSQREAVMRLSNPGHLDGADAIAISSLTYWSLPDERRATLEVLPVTEPSGQPSRIPNDAIVARADLDPALKEQIRSILIDSLQPGSPVLATLAASTLGTVGFRRTDLDAYRPVQERAKRVLPHGNRYSIDQVLTSIRWNIEHRKESAESHGETFTPRIALVLAGGGAAGAHQGGAVSEVCRAMREGGLAPFLVVGTSVGAANATAAALGHADKLESFWAPVSLDKVFVVPEEDMPLGAWRLRGLQLLLRAPALVGLAGLLILIYLQLMVFFWLLESGGARRWPGILLSIGLVTFVMSWLGVDSLLGMLSAASLALSLALRGLRQRLMKIPGIRPLLYTIHAATLAVLFVLGPAEIHRTFIERRALFANHKLHRYFAKQMLPIMGIKGEPADEKIFHSLVRTQSRRAVAKKPPTSLVISTTDFEHQSVRYFYLAADAEVERRADQLGFISIERECPEGIADVVLASASIFPLVEPVKMTLKSGEVLHLSDGGFLHNNPVKVAVDLGATHVIILKPSPEYASVSTGSTLLGNLGCFFGSLIFQSQTEDFRAGDETMSFILQPEAGDGSEIIGPLEFDGHYTGSWDPTTEATFSVHQYFKAGALATRSYDRGFQLWSRGPIVLPPIERPVTSLTR